MPKTKKTKVKTEEIKVKEVKISSNTMSKEEWCKANGITRIGSNHAEVSYTNYLASLA